MSAARHQAVPLDVFEELVFEVWSICFQDPRGTSHDTLENFPRVTGNDIGIVSKRFSPGFFKEKHPGFIFVTVGKSRRVILDRYVVIKADDSPNSINTEFHSINTF